MLIRSVLIQTRLGQLTEVLSAHSSRRVINIQKHLRAAAHASLSTCIMGSFQKVGFCFGSNGHIISLGESKMALTRPLAQKGSRNRGRSCSERISAAGIHELGTLGGAQDFAAHAQT